MIEIVLVILAAYLIIEYAVEKTTMMGVSMNTTLNDGEKIIINKLAYLKGEPERFDVIVFSQSKSGHGYYNIKRVIGLPGETVQIDENGIADIKYMVDAGYIVVAAERKFDKDRDYLWPIPASDRLINDKLTQNPNW